MITGNLPSSRRGNGFDELLADRVDETLYFGLFRLAYRAIDRVPVLLIASSNDLDNKESVCLLINGEVYDMLTRCYRDMMLYEVSDVINDKSINVAITEDILGESCLVSASISTRDDVSDQQGYFDLSFNLACSYKDGRSICNSLNVIPHRKILISQARDLFGKLTTVNGRGYSPISAFCETQVEKYI